jgi:hypothetical protein
LDAKLRVLPDLLHVTPETWSHFGSDMKYSSHALPINTLLDTLIRPDADTCINPVSCVEWRYHPERAISHIVLGSAKSAGGQWTLTEGVDIDQTSTLSYAEFLSLPGYTMAQHYLRVNGTPMPELERPSREFVAAYYAQYPSAVGIAKSVHMSSQVGSIVREENGFRLQPMNVVCKRLVLGTGIFDHFISPPPSSPMSLLTKCHSSNLPLLIVGSGYSAADAIISSPNRKIIHVFKWDPTNGPSPLKGCHHQAYPEYASVYRQMKKAAAKAHGKSSLIVSPLVRRQSNSYFGKRDWDCMYEGLPNASVEAVKNQGSHSIVRIRQEDGTSIEYTIGGYKYLIGRRGSLSYLDAQLRTEVFQSQPSGKISFKELSNISGRTLRSKAEVDTEIAPSVFIIGSLTGDTLVRHSFGSSVYAASRILGVVSDAR